MIPAESGEKITLGISTMLNMTVFLMTVMSGLPATDQTPILSELSYYHFLNFNSSLVLNQYYIHIRFGSSFRRKDFLQNLIFYLLYESINSFLAGLIRIPLIVTP